MSKCQKKYKVSLKWFITFIFVGIMALTILAIWIATHFLLERYYLDKKEQNILSFYQTIRTAGETGTITSESFDMELQKYSSTHGVSVVILTSMMEPMKIYANEPQDQLVREFITNLNGTVIVNSIIRQTDDYVMVRKNDKRFQSEFIEMWGILPDGSYFLLRTAVESIKNSAEIAGNFLVIIGVTAILISAGIIYLFTSRVSRPILEMADISEKMSQMDFETKYSGKDRTEISVLGNNINKMSQNLEAAISELKEANIALKKDNDYKTEIDRMRKEFISNVSHELKTPIALIQGYAEGLKEGINEAEERDYYCDVIMDEASRMNGMVKQLLNLDQIESGFDALQITRFDITELVKNYVQSAELLAKQGDINVRILTPGPVFVWADEFKIEEVIMNFFSNAVNHCESDKEKRIDVSVEKEENTVKVSVFNTGSPIPEDSLAHIWDKFYKVDKARTREYGGSGVGLSIVKAIIEAHNQKYGVENLADGVNFWFTVDSSER